MNLMHHIYLLPIILFTIFSISCARDTISPSKPLSDNETLVSYSGRFALGFFSPVNSSGNQYVGIWFHNISEKTVVWVANRMNPISITNPNSSGLLSITTGGMLTLINQNSTVVWSKRAKAGLTNPVAQLLDSGNFVVKQDGDNIENYAWQSFDYPTDTLLPGMKLGVDLTSGLTRNLTAWRSNNDPSPGEFILAVDINGDPEIYLYFGSTKQWRSGPWDRDQFMGIPIQYQGFTSSFVNTSVEITYSYHLKQLIRSRITIDPSGILQWLVWPDFSAQWSLFWQVPKDQCDNLGECGPNAVCDPNENPMCSCLQGFVPNKPGNWALRDWSDGCSRRTEVDCTNGGDVFRVVKGVKLPDARNSTTYTNLNIDDCAAVCLKHCSCTAYHAGGNLGEDSIGCVMWEADLLDIKLYDGSENDLYVRLADPAQGSISGHSNKNRREMLAIVLSIIMGMLLVACMTCFLWIRRKKKRNASIFLKDHSNERAKENYPELPSFDFSTISAATNYFSDGNKLGEGGFGPVYKGKLGEDQEMAVKRLAKTSQQGVNEFKNEVMLIAKLQHINLVRLVGCCIHGEERMLIYEYMLNKSLDAFLFDKEKAALLNWKTRYQIIIRITRGLVYLHHDSRFRIIHRDLKASNILLDKDMNAKISDFGMARIFGGDETDFNTRKVVGTYGYMSPEYALDGIFSMKSDVFSFGVLVLEIISGRKNRGMYAYSPHLNLVAHAWSSWNEGKSSQLVDESISHSVVMSEVLKCIKIGLLCVQERAEDRPLMSTVIQMLGSDISSLPQPKQPGFVARMDPLGIDPSSSKQTSNEITASLFEGR